jgi:hypothetical protein
MWEVRVHVHGCAFLQRLPHQAPGRAAETSAHRLQGEVSRMEEKKKEQKKDLGKKEDKETGKN